MSLLRKKDSPAQVHPSALVKMSEVGLGSSIGKDATVLTSSIGRCCDIESRNLVRDANIGDMSYTEPDVSIMWADLGKYCCVARMVDIGGNAHNHHAASMMPTYRVRLRLGGKVRTHHPEERIIVGNDVWIGSGAIILRKPGMVIGDGAVIGAGSVVTHPVPPYAIVSGVPARIMGYRFDNQTIGRLLSLRWWDWPDDLILSSWELLSGNLDEDSLARLEEIVR